MFVLLALLWFIFELKYVLFWLYLWQLKEYHAGRFLDHFRTHKGKRLLFSFSQIAKLVVLLLLLSDLIGYIFLFSVLFLIYLAEALLFLKQIFSKAVKKPVQTLKARFLGIVSFVVVALFLLWTSAAADLFQPVWLLLFDLLTLVIISAIVLFFQPFFVAIRNNVLKKAEIKMKKTKAISGLKVIAITGSYGKTSTKEFLTTILSKKFNVLSTKEHQNSEAGIAKSILEDLTLKHQIFIAEVGAYNKGKVKQVCSMIQPNIGIVTGVNEQHLSLFGSMENLLLAEGGGELANCLQKDGILAVNGDNKYCLELLRNNSNLPQSQEKKYAINNKTTDADIWTEDVEVKKDSISFLAINKNKELAHFDVKVLGKQNVQNLLGAILIARELGINFDQISQAARDIKQEQAGMVLRRGKHGIEIIDSSYSSNPDGVFADLEYLSIYSAKKVIVMPCLIELGEKSAQIHEKIGRKIAQVCDLAIITTKDKFKELKKGAMDLGMKEENILFCENPGDIYSIITLFAKSGDAVLLEGRVPQKLIDLLTA